MAGKKDKRPSWFKIYSSNRRTYDAIPNESLGAAFKAAMRYFETGGKDEAIAAGITDELTKIAFETFLTGVNESIEEYSKRVEDGRRGQEAKQNKEQTAAQKAALEQYGTPEPHPQQPKFSKGA